MASWSGERFHTTQSSIELEIKGGFAPTTIYFAREFESPRKQSFFSIRRTHNMVIAVNKRDPFLVNTTTCLIVNMWMHMERASDPVNVEKPTVR